MLVEVEMSQETPVVEVRDLKVHFHVKNAPAGEVWSRHDVVKAVDGVTLGIRRGEVISLVGESGSGKTTLGRAIIALTPPTSGEVFVEGRKIDYRKKSALKGLWKSMQMVFQDPYSTFNPLSTVLDNLSTPLRKFKIATGEGDLRKRVEDALSGVGLRPDEVLDKYPNQLSGGQRQRVSIARAMVVGPEVLIADEPVSMIDVSLRAGILQLLKELNLAKKLTIVFITHDLAVAQYLSDRIAVMYRGKIVEIGTSKDVVASPLHPYTQLLIKSAPRLRGEQSWNEADSNVLKSVDSYAFSGCAFYPRCPIGVDRCVTAEPALFEVTKGHFVSCFVRGNPSERGPTP
jgi:peptide/nickel transport system ATP-binding protein